MALPAAGAIGGLIAGAIMNMLATRVGYILAGLGIMLATAVGIDLLAAQIVVFMDGKLAEMGTIVANDYPIGQAVVDVIGRAGFFQALNIITSAYLTRAGLLSASIAVRRLSAS